MTDFRYEGITGFLILAADAQRESGVTFEKALETVIAAHEPKSEPESNVVRMADHVRRKAEKTIGAL